MTRAALIAGLLCGGCLVVPKTQTTSRRVGTEDGLATFAAARAVSIETSVEGPTLHVQAKRLGDCTQPVYEVIETTKDRHAGIGGASDPRAQIFGVLLAPVTIPVSALVTGLALAGSHAQTTRVTRAIGTKKFACSLEADHLTIAIALPSGETVSRMTTRDGRVALDIPDTEPYTGSVAVSAPTAEPVRVAYELPRPAITTLRDSVMECGTQHGVRGPVTAKVTVSDSGRATRVWLSAGDASFNACVAQRITNVAFPEKARGVTLSVPLTITAMR